MSAFVGSHFYLWAEEPADRNSQTEWDKIPDPWKSARFDAVDVLFITPFRVTPEGEFGLGTCEKGRCNLQKRFDWLIANARDRNPKIRMFATQWYDDTIDGNGFKDLEPQDKATRFADSVAKFFHTQAEKTVQAESGKQIPARLDGWDVDVEKPGGNRGVSGYGPPYSTKVPWLVDVVAGVRS